MKESVYPYLDPETLEEMARVCRIGGKEMPENTTWMNPENGNVYVLLLIQKREEMVSLDSYYENDPSDWFLTAILMGQGKNY